MLYHDHILERRKQRMKCLGEALESYGHSIFHISISGDLGLMRMLNGVLLFDYLSAFLADLNNVSVAPIEPVEQIKTRMRFVNPF